MTLIKLKSRFKTIQSLNSILSAMQVVAVVRMQRAKEKYARTENYLNSLKNNLRGRFGPETRVNKMMLVMTSNRSLCGDFNQSLVSKVEDYISDKPGFKLMTLGKRGAEFFIRSEASPDYPKEDVMAKLDFKGARGLFSELFAPERELYIAHNRYHGSIKLIPSIYRLYPSPEELQTGLASEALLEPTPQRFVSGALRFFLEARFYQLLLNSLMGELTSRLMVLNGAVENSKDLINSLRITINKARQTHITRELAEVVASAEILRSEEDE